MNLTDTNAIFTYIVVTGALVGFLAFIMWAEYPGVCLRTKIQIRLHLKPKDAICRHARCQRVVEASRRAGVPAPPIPLPRAQPIGEIQYQRTKSTT